MNEFGTAAILAGGKSLRMGFDKNRLSINGESLQERQINTLRPLFDEVLIIRNDEIPGKGPLGGIYTALMRSSSKFVYFLACDMPCINIDYIQYMMDELRGRDYEACVTRISPHIEPMNSFYSRSLLPAIKEDLLADKLSIYHLLRRSHCLYVEEEQARKFSPNWQMFLNLNTREDLANYAEQNL